MAGRPGWPATEGATYELLLEQLENDLTPNGGATTAV